MSEEKQGEGNLKQWAPATREPSSIRRLSAANVISSSPKILSRFITMAVIDVGSLGLFTLYLAALNQSVEKALDERPDLGYL